MRRLASHYRHVPLDADPPHALTRHIMDLLHWLTVTPCRAVSTAFLVRCRSKPLSRLPVPTDRDSVAFDARCTLSMSAVPRYLLNYCVCVGNNNSNPTHQTRENAL